METKNKNILVNRVVSFVIGGVLVFAVMSFTVVRTANDSNDALTSALDTSRYEAGRLFADAEVQLEAGNYDAARETLETLFANQPGSEESEVGRQLLVSLNEQEQAADARWEEALPEIRATWTAEMAARLRDEADEDRAEAEANIEAEVTEAWEEARADVRAAFEDQA
jgi:predicted Zn-dependent protease